MLNVLIQIDADWKAVTDEEIARAELNLEDFKMPKKRRVYGVIASREVKALWALQRRYDQKGRLFRDRAEFEANSTDEKREHEREVARYSALERIAVDLFWMEARAEIGPEAWDNGSLGLRRGWQIVQSQPRPSLGQLVGGLSIPIEPSAEEGEEA